MKTKVKEERKIEGKEKGVGGGDIWARGAELRPHLGRFMRYQMF